MDRNGDDDGDDDVGGDDNDDDNNSHTITEEARFYVAFKSFSFNQTAVTYSTLLRTAGRTDE